MKKLKRKYQIGGNKLMDNVPTPEEFAKQEGLTLPPPSNFESADFQPNYGMKPTFGGGTNDSFIPFSSVRNTGDLTYHPLFKLFNTLALGTTGLANKFSDAATDKRQRLLNIKSLQTPNYLNTNQDGLDNSPIYAKYGIHIKPENKGKFTAYKKRTGKTTEEALHSKDAHVRKMAQFAKNAKSWNHQAGGNVWGNAATSTLDAAEDLKRRGLIGADQLIDDTGKVNPNDPNSIRDSQSDWKIAMIKNVLTNAKKLNLTTPEQINANRDVLIGNSKWSDAVNNDSFNTIHPNFWDVVNKSILPEQSAASTTATAMKQAGGDDSPNDNDGQKAELEEGEVYQNPQGDINKIPEDAGTHEEGGVQPADNVARVLEDTSDKRKDKASKLLKMSPDTVEGLTGFKPKTSLSHSKAHEKAIEFYNKKSTAIMSKVKKNVEGDDQYASNSLKFNAETISHLPKEQQIFDALFDHQEKVKSLFGIQDNGMKAQYGIQAYKGDKTTNANASKYSTDQWDAMAKDLGFTGSGTREFQQFLFNQNGDQGGTDLQTPVIGLHNKFGNPNTPPNTNSMYNWLDNRLGHRWDAAYEQWQNSKQPQGLPTNNGTAEDYSDTTPQPNNLGVPVPKGSTDTPNSKYPATSTKKNGFNYPLNWYDVAAPLDAYLGATKAHINYNPATTHQIQLKGVNPLPTLQQGQSDFNGELAALANTGVNGGVQLANVANLYARKYSMNNQVLGNAENTNAGIKNQETEYNAKAADQQSSQDQQARAIFERENLGADEAVRQQKLTAEDSLFHTIAQNKKFNFEGNLLMKLFPNFTPTGDYNGKQYNFRNPVSIGTGASTPNVNEILENAGIDPNSVPPKDRARYAVQIAKKRFYPTKRS